MTDPNRIMEQLLDAGTATVYEAQGQYGALDGAIRPVDPGFRLRGRALTVDCHPADNLAIHRGVHSAQPGDVLVIDAKSYTEAGAWGDVLTAAAQARGIAGLVIDGAVRDTANIIAMKFPVFSRGISIKGTSKAARGRVNVPILCAGARVSPGDIVLGDRDGVVVVPYQTAPDLLSRVESRLADEEDLRREVASGRSTLELMGLAE